MSNDSVEVILCISPSIAYISVHVVVISLHILVAQQQGLAQIEIDAQAQAVEFYRKFGFRVVSDIFIEAGIPQLKMVLEIKK